MMGLVWAVSGGMELKDNFAAKAPAALTWQEFIEEKPKDGWFKVSGAQLDVTSGLWVENILTGEMGNIYVPARVVGSESADESPIEMLVKIDDAKIAATMKELKALDKGTDEAALKYVLSHAEQLVIERPLVGTLADGLDAVDSGDELTLRGAEVAFADDLVILQEGTKPDVGGRIFMLLGGIGLSLLGLFYIFLKKPAPPANSPLSAPPSAPLSNS